MSDLNILTFPDAFLKKTAKQVSNIDGKLQQLVEAMGNTMYNAPGVGLAAIQVGIDLSFLVYDVTSRDDQRNLQVLINPEIVESEGHILSENEGCLSVPDLRANVRRSARILVEGADRNGNPLRLEADGMLAIVLQHEIDHLNGTLFIDHLSALKRQMYARKIKKRLKNAAS